MQWLPQEELRAWQTVEKRFLPAFQVSRFSFKFRARKQKTCFRARFTTAWLKNAVFFTMSITCNILLFMTPSMAARSIRQHFPPGFPLLIRLSDPPAGSAV
jgi:hypothetical protein